MQAKMPSAIRLKEAFFCLSCEVVTNCSDSCPACGDRKLWHLEHWLGRINAYESIEDKVPTSQEVSPGEILKILTSASANRNQR